MPSESLGSHNPMNARYEVGQLFTPATPISEKDLFAGRHQQLQTIVNTISQRGQHAIIFGERGVGKTSLANVLAGFFMSSGIPKTIVAPRVTCHTADTFPALWQRLFKEVKTGHGRSMVLGERANGNGLTLDDAYGGALITPDVVREALATVSDKAILIIIVDEFDRLSDRQDNQLFADTIKALSDYAVRATLVLVGVADAVDELIAGHESIQRNLVQVPMPRMSTSELRQIVTDRLPKVQMTIEEEALAKICALSRGLPHYTHLIAQHSAWIAIEKVQRHITMGHVEQAVTQAISNAQQTVQSAYHRATMSPRKDNLFAHVLLASALASCDEFGYFAAADVRGPMSDIMHEEYGISRFIGHLGKFTEETRGEILQEIGERYQRRFRFRNPLMQPYIIMRGVASRLITLDQLKEHPGKRDQ